MIQFMLDLHTREHGYREVYVPYLVNARVPAPGHLPSSKQTCSRSGVSRVVYLIPTAEVPVTNLVRDAIVEAERCR